MSIKSHDFCVLIARFTLNILTIYIGVHELTTSRVSIPSGCNIPPNERICIALYDPICGTDGKLYSNHCWFIFGQCDNPSLKIGSKSLCEGK